MEINENFVDEQLFRLKTISKTPWYVDIANYLAQDVLMGYHTSPCRGHFESKRTTQKGKFREGMRCCKMGFWDYFPIPLKTNILLAKDYVSKWEEAIALPTNDMKAIVKLLGKNIFA
ncbi:protein NYNRIN-like [Gossypium australe]|uniref:Protein NYNRIN-like n=1 Tax=Gossypium australe TaxID=47621 RepID=A0A5B6X0D6_9ROSI|nr:protein NYNRIN-like [Gossypium australe]